MRALTPGHFRSSVSLNSLRTKRRRRGPRTSPTWRVSKCLDWDAGVAPRTKRVEPRVASERAALARSREPSRAVVVHAVVRHAVRVRPRLRFAAGGILVADVVLVPDAFVQGVEFLDTVRLFDELFELFALRGAVHVGSRSSAELPLFAEIHTFVSTAGSEQKEEEKAWKKGARFRRHKSLILQPGPRLAKKARHHGRGRFRASKRVIV